MKRLASFFTTALGVILLLSMPGLTQAARAASTVGVLEGGGCRPAYSGNGFVRTYPCISVSGGYFRADAYNSGLPSNCAYYLVYIVDVYQVLRDGVVAVGPQQRPCTQGRSDVTLYPSAGANSVYLSRITVFDSSHRKIGTLESPRIWI